MFKAKSKIILAILLSWLLPRRFLLFGLKQFNRIIPANGRLSGTNAILQVADPTFLRQLKIVYPANFKTIRSIDGYSYLCDVNDHIGYWLYVKGYFDLVPTQIFSQLLSNISPLFYLDLGANIGTTMVPLACKIPTLGIDMNDKSFYQLSYNNYLANSQAVIIKAALTESSEISSKSLTSSSYYINAGNAGSTSMLKGFNKSQKQEVKQVFCTSIDKIINAFCDFSKISLHDTIFVKIDLEGFEYKVLKDSYVLQSNVIGLIEYRPDLSSETSISVVDLLIESGYDVRTVINTGSLLQPVFRLLPFDASVRQENVLFYRSTSLDLIQKSFTFK